MHGARSHAKSGRVGTEPVGQKAVFAHELIWRYHMAKAEKVIDSLDALNSRLASMRKAQAEFATFSQEQVDKIFHAAAIAAN